MKRNLGALPAVFPMPVLMVAAYDAAGNVGILCFSASNCAIISLARWITSRGRPASCAT